MGNQDTRTLSDDDVQELINDFDDNGDGVLGSGDIPDIVIMTDDGGAATHFQGVMRVISGDGTRVHWSVMNQDIDGGQILIALPAFILQGCTASW